MWSVWWSHGPWLMAGTSASPRLDANCCVRYIFMICALGYWRQIICCNAFRRTKHLCSDSRSDLGAQTLIIYLSHICVFGILRAHEMGKSPRPPWHTNFGKELIESRLNTYYASWTIIRAVVSDPQQKEERGIRAWCGVHLSTLIEISVITEVGLYLLGDRLHSQRIWLFSIYHDDSGINKCAGKYVRNFSVESIRPTKWAIFHWWTAELHMLSTSTTAWLTY